MGNAVSKSEVVSGWSTSIALGELRLCDGRLQEAPRRGGCASCPWAEVVSTSTTLMPRRAWPWVCVQTAQCSLRFVFAWQILLRPLPLDPRGPRLDVLQTLNASLRSPQRLHEAWMLLEQHSSVELLRQLLREAPPEALRRLVHGSCLQTRHCDTPPG